MIEENKQLWEILVPTTFNDGVSISLKHHKKWDELVMAIAGGLTIMRPSKGRWTTSSGEEFLEDMIPVRILCTREQIEEIIQLTLGHYEQKAVLAFRVSNEAILKYSDG